MGDVVKNFEYEFHNDEIELLILAESPASGGAMLSGYIMPSITFIAAVDTKTGTLSTMKGRLEWLVIDDKKRKGSYGHYFEELTVYRVRVKKCIEKELAPYILPEMNNRYMLLEVLEKKVAHAELEEIARKYAEPVLINDETLGEFELDRQYGQFEGEIDWLGESCSVSLDTEEGCDSAEVAMSVLKKMHADAAGRDAKMCEYAAGKLTALANKWQQDKDKDAEPMSEEDFAQRMTINAIHIFDDGAMEIYYDDDFMFWGHVIMIDVDEFGEITDATIAG